MTALSREIRKASFTIARYSLILYKQVLALNVIKHN